MRPEAAAGWRTSSYSSGPSGGCVEVGRSNLLIVVRDTKNRDGKVLAVTSDAWQMLAATLK